MFSRVFCRNIDTPVQNPAEPYVEVVNLLAPLRFSRVVLKDSILIHLMMTLQQNLVDLDWNQKVQRMREAYVQG